MVNIMVAGLFGSESRAREPQSEQTLYICIRINAGHAHHSPAKSPTALLLLEVLRSFNKLPQINRFVIDAQGSLRPLRARGNRFFCALSIYGVPGG